MTELPANWKTKSVGELADTQLGKMLNKGKQSGKFAKPYLRTDNVHWGKFDLSEIKEMDILPEEEEKYLARSGDLLMCEGGASGRTAIWNQNYNISFQNHIHRIRPKDVNEIAPKYLLYYFEWFIKNGFANDLIKGVTISSLSQSGLRSIDVAYPPLPEQHKIVEILEDHLSRLDAALADVKQAKLKAAQFRRSLLQAAFTGNLGSDGTRLMTKLPYGWKSCILADIAKWGSGGTPTAGNKSFYDGDIPWAIIGDLNDGVVTTTARTITNKGLESSSAKMVPTGAVLVAMYGSIGKLGIAGISLATNQAIAFAIPNESLITQKYLFYFLWSQREKLLWSGKGATQLNISQTILKAWKIPIPPLPEQHKIVEILEDHLSRLDASVALADAMEKQSAGLRRSLLQAAFTGQLTKEVTSV